MSAKHVTDFGSAFNQTKTARIPCIPLQAVLDAAGLQHINLFSLDVEGGELAVLQSIDWARTSFDVILLESDGSNRTKDQGCHALLKRNGYVLDHLVTINAWYVRKGFVRKVGASGLIE